MYRRVGRIACDASEREREHPDLLIFYEIASIRDTLEIAKRSTNESSRVMTERFAWKFVKSLMTSRRDSEYSRIATNVPLGR